ncbi:MAG TPA: hypothetical protein VNB06_17075, partial [Thermoanaerobaculia bacterium]|nr:hypothetical protein [Thermoanaerobaculia bacterium]
MSPSSMAPPEAASEHLDSWKEIAGYLERSVRTVQRWERDEGLPIHRHRHRRGDSVFATTREIDAWRELRRSASDRETGPRRSRSPAPGVERLPSSVAVLPFSSRGLAPGEEYLAEGLTDELIRLLARVPGLRVAARTSSFALADRRSDVRDIGRRLGVAYVLEGSVRRFDGRLRVTAYLADARDGYQLWAEEHETQPGGLLAAAATVSEWIAATVPLEPGAPAPRPQTSRRTDDRAQDEYLRGRQLWHQRTADSLGQALACFERAIAIDPELALAHVGMAEAWEALGALDALAPHDCRPRAKAAAQRALE